MSFGKRNSKVTDKRVDFTKKTDYEKNNSDSYFLKTSKFITRLVLVACLGYAFFTVQSIIGLLAQKSIANHIYKEPITFNKILPTEKQRQSDECILSGSEGNQPDFDLIITYDAFEKTADYLTCVMTNDKHKFCEDHHKKKLVKHLEAFVIGHRDWLKRQKAAKKFSKVISGLQHRTIKDAETRPLFENMSDDGSLGAFPETLPTRFGIALSDLIRDGFLSRSDFGWFGFGVPKPLEAFLKIQVNDARVCDY